MSSFVCPFCEEHNPMEKTVRPGQKILCALCLQAFEVVSVDPFVVEPEAIPLGMEWGNPEKSARVKRLEMRAKLDDDEDDDFDEDYGNPGTHSGRNGGKRRPNKKKRLRTLPKDYEDDGYY